MLHIIKQHILDILKTVGMGYSSGQAELSTPPKKNPDGDQPPGYLTDSIGKYPRLEKPLYGREENAFQEFNLFENKLFKLRIKKLLGEVCFDILQTYIGR